MFSEQLKSWSSENKTKENCENELVLLVLLKST